VALEKRQQKSYVNFCDVKLNFPAVNKQNATATNLFFRVINQLMRLVYSFHIAPSNTVFNSSRKT
jgi:hypothetical protein